MLTIPAPYVRALASMIAHPDDSRLALHHLELSRDALTATSGHALLSIALPEIDERRPVSTVLVLPGRNIPKSAHEITIHVDGPHTHWQALSTNGRLLLDETTTNYTASPYPDWRKAISPKGGTNRVPFQPQAPRALRFNPTLVATAVEELARVTNDPAPQLLFSDRPKAKECKAPIKLNFPGHPDITLILMPCLPR